MSDVSFQLNEDQLTLQKWIHDFAEDVIRPAAAEWDEQEEFPWPIVQEAAKIGLYGIDFMANAMMGDPTGLTMPVAIEELFWGDAGIGLAIMGSGLAAAGIMGNGTPEQLMEWVPQCYGTPDDVKLGAFCVSEPDAGSDVSSLRTKAVYDEAKDEWVLNGTKAWITNGGIADIHVVVATVDPELRGRGQASFIVPPEHARSLAGPEVLEDGHPGVAHRRGRARGRAGPRLAACSAARTSSTRSWPGPARRCRTRRSHSGKQPAMATFEATRPAVAAQAVGVARAAYEYALQYATERVAFGKPIAMHQGIGFMLADMATEIDAARLLGVAGRLALEERRLPERRGLDVEAQGRPHRRVGHRAGHPDPRRLRLRQGVPGRALAPRRRRSSTSSRAPSRSSSSSSAGPSPASASSNRPSRPGTFVPGSEGVANCGHLPPRRLRDLLPGGDVAAALGGEW